MHWLGRVGSRAARILGAAVIGGPGLGCAVGLSDQASAEPQASLIGTNQALEFSPDLAGPGRSDAGITPMDDGNPSGVEQEMLELINRARQSPVAEAFRHDLELNEGVPAELTISTAAKPPLAMNATLLRVARAHSDDMLARDFFSHADPDGLDPDERVTNSGYDWTHVGENIALIGSTTLIRAEGEVAKLHANLFIDRHFPNRGHRTNMLMPAYREVGVGVRTGRFYENGSSYNTVMATNNFGTAPSSPAFVLGVVYEDRNRNGIYNAGEGLADVEVTVGLATYITRAAGGTASPSARLAITRSRSAAARSAKS